MLVPPLDPSMVIQYGLQFMSSSPGDASAPFTPESVTILIDNVHD